MRHLKWLVKLCFLWHVIKIIRSHGELLSKESIFELNSQHPTVQTNNGSHVIKNISKVCYDRNDTHDGDDKIVKATTTASSSLSDNSTVNILNIFENILKHFRTPNWESRLYEQVQSERQDEVQQREQLGNQQHKVGQQQSFSILQQLRLEEEKQKWQQQQSQLQQQQHALRLENILQDIANESLGKAGKKKKKKKKKKKRKKKKKPVKDKKKKRKKKKGKPTKKPTSLLAHPAQILFASATQKPHHQNDDDHHHTHHQTSGSITTTTTPTPYLHHPLIPINKIKYILRKNTILKKKKKEYLNHLKHILYPFVKFITFFTIINPFTLAAFLFSLVSPVVLGFLGFISLSLFIKPALNFLFSIKHTVNAIKRRKLQQLRRRQRLRNSRRPITIHKHYYQQRPIAPPPPHRQYPARPPRLRHPLSLRALKPKGSIHHTLPLGNPHRQHAPHIQQVKLFNPLLPDVRQKLTKKDKYFIPDIKGQNDSFEQFQEHVYLRALEH